MPNLVIYDIQEESAMARIDGLDPTYAFDDRYVTYGLNYETAGDATIPAFASSGGNFTFVALSAGADYFVQAVVQAGAEQWYLETYFKTLPPPRPSRFNWTVQPQTGGVISTMITASDWGRLQSNINSVRNYKGMSAYSFTTVYSGNIITANIYNECVFAIQGMSGQGQFLQQKQKGDLLLASDFVLLQTSINNV